MMIPRLILHAKIKYDVVKLWCSCLIVHDKIKDYGECMTICQLFNIARKSFKEITNQMAQRTWMGLKQLEKFNFRITKLRKGD